MNARLLAGLTALWLGTAAAWAQAEKPQYGGALEIVTVYPTLSALSWDLADWNWKQNHDAGLFYETLFAADLSKSKRKGGKHPFYADAWLPSDAIRGELAESWEWKDNPLRVEIKLRKGIMFPEKPGVMAARELTAEDVLLQLQPPRQEPEEDRGLFRSSAEGARARPAHGRVRVQGVQRRVGLPLRLGLLLRRDAEGGRRRRRRATGRTPTAPARSC